MLYTNFLMLLTLIQFLLPRVPSYAFLIYAVNDETRGSQSIYCHFNHIDCKKIFTQSVKVCGPLD